MGKAIKFFICQKGNSTQCWVVPWSPSIFLPNYCSKTAPLLVSLTSLKKRNNKVIPLACGLLFGVSSPAPNPGGPFQSQGSSLSSLPPWVCKAPVSEQSPSCSCRIWRGCLMHMLRRTSLPQWCRVEAADRGCAHIGSYSCGAPLRILQVGCSLSSTGETGNGRARKTEACTRKWKETEGDQKTPLGQDALLGGGFIRHLLEKADSWLIKT